MTFVLRFGQRLALVMIAFVSFCGLINAQSSLTTTLAGGGYVRGNSFDIEAKVPIIINSFDVHPFQVDESTRPYAVWYVTSRRSWQLANNVGPLTGWTLLATPTAAGSTYGVAAPLGLNLGFQINPGERIGFHIEGISWMGGLSTTNGAGSGGYPHSSDPYLNFYRGDGGDKKNSSSSSKWVWNGKIRYSLAGTGQADDIAILGVDSPVEAGECRALSAAETVSFTMQNLGNTLSVGSTFMATLSLDGTPIATESFVVSAQTLPKLAHEQFSFVTTLDLSVGGVRAIDIELSYPPDTDLTNNSASTFVNGRAVIDLGTNSLDAPVTAAPCATLSSTEAVSFTVKNNSATTLNIGDTFMATVNVDGVVAHSEVFTVSANPIVCDATETFTFVGTIDLSAGGTHTVDVSVSILGDVDMMNDSASSTIDAGGSCQNGQLTHILSVEGQSTYGLFGLVVTGLGDVNGDGVPDFAAKSIDKRVGISNKGRVQIYSGKDQAVLYTLITQFETGSSFGTSINNAGDVDGDGVNDLIIGDPIGEAGRTGGAYIYSGATGILIHTFAGSFVGEEFGDYVAGVGDINNDGYDDVAIGSDEHPQGFVFVYSGFDGSLIHTLGGFVRSYSSNDRLSISGIGDVNADGHRDLVVGNPGGYSATTSSIPGAAWVYSGLTGQIIHTVLGTGDERFGVSVDGLDDINGDGVADFVVVSSNTVGTSIVARLYSGVDGSLIRPINTLGGTYGSEDLAKGIGDQNGDGISDILIGESQASGPLQNSGSIRAISGADGSTIFTLFGKKPYLRIGAAIAPVGDMDGDGREDFVYGNAFASSPGVVMPGRAIVVGYQSPDFAGSGDDFFLKVGINDLPSGFPWIKPAQSNDVLNVEIGSPEHTYYSEYFLLAAQLFDTAMPTPSPFGYSEAFINPNSSLAYPVAAVFNGLAAGPSLGTLQHGGFQDSYNLGYIPPGFSFMIQAFAFRGGSTNPYFTASNAFEVRMH